MKKLIIIALLATATTGFVTSCTKDNSIAPAKSKTITVADKSELGQGDINGSDTTSRH